MHSSRQLIRSTLWGELTWVGAIILGAIFRGTIFLGGNYPGGNCPKGSYLEGWGQFSSEEIVLEPILLVWFYI